jgi:MGT family glycosyltransferase
MMAASLNFLFTTCDGGGNVAPVMAVVERLIAHGHRVRVMSDDSTRDEVMASGARFVPWRAAPNKPRRSREFDPPDWSVSPTEGLRMMCEHFMGGLATLYAQDTLEELDRERPDLVVNFDMLAGVIVACESRHQKLVLLSTCISMFPIEGVPPFGSALAPASNDAERVRLQTAEREIEALFDAGLAGLNAARERLGLPALAHFVHQARSAQVRFIGTARAFDFPARTLPDDVRYVGPLLRDPVWAAPWESPWPANDTRPLVVAGFSTSFQNHAGCLQRIIGACEALPVRLLVTLGGSIRPDELAPAANTVTVDSAPHGLVMRDAAAVVTHGGHGTLMTALVHGVPVLVLPHGRDQGDNGARVHWHGAGLCLTNTASAAELRAALRSLLESDSYRAAAGELGARIREEVRESRLIDNLESLALGNREAD